MTSHYLKQWWFSLLTRVCVTRSLEYFGEIWKEIRQFSCHIVNLKLLSANCLPFYVGHHVLKMTQGSNSKLFNSSMIQITFFSRFKYLQKCRNRICLWTFSKLFSMEIRVGGGVLIVVYWHIETWKKWPTFSDDIFKYIFFNENICILIQFHWNSFPKVHLTIGLLALV